MQSRFDGGAGLLLALALVTGVSAGPALAVDARRAAVVVRPQGAASPSVPGCVDAAVPLGRENGALPRVDVRCEVPPGGLPPLTPQPPVVTPAPVPPVVAPATPPATSPPPDKSAGAPPVPAPQPAPQPPSTPVGAPGQSKPPLIPFTDPGFRYYPPGNLMPQDAGRGRADRRVYFPNLVYPMKLGDGQHPHMNSQIWGYGGGGYGGKGEVGGSECDPRNYDPMRQRDDYCEVRGWDMPMCPAGKGHQGQDIRPAACKDNTWEVVAAADGTVTLVSSYTTVRIKGTDGTTYEYLHMHPGAMKVKAGQKVKAGDVIGRVSNYMSGPKGTTLHLHFQVRRQMTVKGKLLDAYVPIYTSLIASYRRMKGVDPGIDADGNLIIDPRLEIGAAQPAPEPPKPAPVPAPEPQKPAPAPAPEPPKPAEPAPAPAPEPPKPAPVPAPEPQKPAPAPAPEPPKPAEPAPAPAPEPPKPAEPAPAPAPEPPKPAEPAPAPAPEPPKPAEPAPAPAPEPPKPAEPAPAPAPEPPKPADPAPAPAPQPVPPSKPVPVQKQGWWDWGKDKVSGWWGYWSGKK